MSTIEPTEERRARNRELLDMPSIQEQCPIKFPVGSVLSDFKGICNRCNDDIEPDLMRGEIKSLGRDVVNIEAIGVCHKCKVVTLFDYRVYDDLRIVGIKDGKWTTWKAISPLRNRLRKFLLGLLRWG